MARVIYINGQEAQRIRMPLFGDITITPRPFRRR
jgi:hypothetical protein